MGFFNRRSESHFRTNANGEILFFPWGPMSRGYVLPSEEMKSTIKTGWCRFIRWMSLSIVLLTLFGVALKEGADSYWIIVAALCVYYFAYFFSVKNVTQGLRLSDERMNWRTLYEQLGDQMSWPILILLSLIGIGSMVALGILVFINGLERSHLIPIGILVICTPLYYLAIRYKLRQSSRLRTSKQSQ